MAVIFVFLLQGVAPTTIDSDDIIQFAGVGGFDDPVFVDQYNDTSHVKSAGDNDDSSGNTPNNNKFISQAGGGGGDSQADWGDGTEDLDQITEAEALLKITVSEAVEVTVTDVFFYAYERDGATTDAPVDVDVRVAEVGDTNFVQAEGSAAALQLNDSDTPATDHDFYIVASQSPEDVGLKPATFRFEAMVT